MSGLDLLGADEIPKRTKVTFGLTKHAARDTFALVAGVVGAFVGRKHPVLSFLGASATASNVHAVATGDRSVKNAARRLGRHVVATASSLTLPSHPVIGYMAGAVAADLLLNDEDGGLVGEFVRVTGTDGILDAEFTEVKPTSTALVKR